MARQGVKSSALFPGQGSRRLLFALGSAFTLGCLLGALSPALAQMDRESVGRAPPLLLGGSTPRKKSEVVLDPVLPTGRLLSDSTPLMKNARCSLRRPVCVESESLQSEDLWRALSLLEQSYEEVEHGMGLLVHSARTGKQLRWQLEPHVRFSVIEASRPSRGFDRGAAYCRGGDISLESARRCVLGAAVVRLAPATAEWLRDGYAAETSRQLGEAPRSSAELATSFQHPGAGVLTSSTRAPSRPEQTAAWVSPLRSARFFGYLERRQRGGLGEAGFLALTLAATTTPPGKSRWDAEPDLADVLFTTMEEDRARMARLFDDFAQDAFSDARSRGYALVPEWEIEGSSLPRTIAFSSPLEPTGSAYATVRLAPGLTGEVFGFRMRCESPVSYVWSVARLDETGREISRFPITFRERGGEASGRVLPVPGMKSLLVVGTNLGGVALTHPFDPDHGPHETHGCTLTVNVVPGDVPDIAPANSP